MSMSVIVYILLILKAMTQNWHGFHWMSRCQMIDIKFAWSRLKRLEMKIGNINRMNDICCYVYMKLCSRTVCNNHVGITQYRCAITRRYLTMLCESITFTVDVKLKKAACVKRQRAAWHTLAIRNRTTTAEGQTCLTQAKNCAARSWFLTAKTNRGRIMYNLRVLNCVWPINMIYIYRYIYIARKK